MRFLAHDVFFTLKDRSPESRQALVAACHEYLSGHPGTVFFSAGLPAEEFDRPVNDRGFDVALHVYLASTEAHDAYQEHPRHKTFIEKMSGNWATVRVFDSWADGGPSRG
jgi:Stress responsive A/B Barrel Domain